MVNIYVIDDSEIVIYGIRQMVSEMDGYTIAGAGKSVAEGIADIKDLKPDVVLLDIELPGMSGIDAIPMILERSGQSRVIILSVYEDKGTIKRALSQGAKGYLPKTAGKDELEEAIKTILNGEVFVSVELMKKFLQSGKAIAPGANQGLRKMDVLENLSAREKEVLQLILKGYTDNEIAEELFLSFNTIKTHRKNILLKTGSKNAVVLAQLAYASGLYS